MEGFPGGPLGDFDMNFDFELQPSVSNPRQHDLLSDQPLESALANEFDQSSFHHSLQSPDLARVHQHYLPNHASPLATWFNKCSRKAGTPSSPPHKSQAG
jgi:hypothetical protein